MGGFSDIIQGVKKTTGQRRITNAVEFVEAPWGLNLPLFPVQRVILKAHYGIELDTKVKFKVPADWRLQNFYDLSEAEYLQYLFNEGRSNIREVVPGKERREMVLSVGRRSGKTLLSAAIAAYETYKLIYKEDPHTYYGISPSNAIQIISIATDKDQAGLLYQEVSGHFRACNFFEPYTANNTMSYARFQTPHDIEKFGKYSDDPTARASLKVTFRSCIAKGLRGAGNIVVIMDEAAHFTDGGQSSAESVYQAVTPSTSTFSPKDPKDKRHATGDVEGRIISISSPLGKQGHFYKLFQVGMKGGKAGENMLCIQAPTWEVNPTLPISEYEKHYYKDPTVFFTEYGGEFTDRTRGWIERSEDLLSCIRKDIRPLYSAPPRRPHYIGIDLGLKNDASAVAIGHIEMVDGRKKIILDLVDQIKAGEGIYADVERLEFETVADWIAGLSHRFYLAEGMFDQWAGIPFEQALQKRGLRQLKTQHMTKQISSDIFSNFKNMMWDKALLLYDWPLPTDGTHCPYITELLELQAEHQTKNIVLVHAPQIEGKHDDMSDALVRMVWLASQQIGNAKHITGVQGQRTLGASGQLSRPTPSALMKTRRTGSSPDRQISRFGRGSTKGKRW